MELSDRLRAPIVNPVIIETLREVSSVIPRIDQLSDDEKERKNQILDALHSSREDMNAQFVVEGALVVCTQMAVRVPIPRRSPSPSEITSKSEMQRLDIETRRRRRQLIAIANPDSSRRGNFLFLDRFLVTMNGPRLLDHLDIEFLPLFGDDPVEESPTPPELFRQNRPRVPSTNFSNTNRHNMGGGLLEGMGSIIDTNSPARGGCGGCKTAGDCNPVIEQLMWQDCDRNNVDVAGANILWMNTAYMFCHTGQGILYISDSGQHHYEVVNILSGVEDTGSIIIDEYLYENFAFYQVMARHISRVETIDYDAWSHTLDRIQTIFNQNISVYMEIAEITNLPPELIAAIHYRESATDFFNGTFNVHLHNGQPLGSTTTIAPIGVRFEEGQFVQAAAHALRGAPWDHDRNTPHDFEVRRNQLGLTSDSRDIVAMVTFGVLYNGWGGRLGGDINGLTAYAFNGTDILTSGRFVADGVFDPDADPGANVGIFPILLRLLNLSI